MIYYFYRDPINFEYFGVLPIIAELSEIIAYYFTILLHISHNFHLLHLLLLLFLFLLLLLFFFHLLFIIHYLLLTNTEPSLTIFKQHPTSISQIWSPY